MRRPHLPLGNIAGTHFWQRLRRRQGHSAIGRIMSMKISNDTIEYTTRYLASCSAMPQPTALPLIPIHTGIAALLSDRNDETRVCWAYCLLHADTVFSLTCLHIASIKVTLPSWNIVIRTVSMPHTFRIFSSTRVISAQLVAALKVSGGRHLSRR